MVQDNYQNFFVFLKIVEDILHNNLEEDLDNLDMILVHLLVYFELFSFDLYFYLFDCLICFDFVNFDLNYMIDLIEIDFVNFDLKYFEFDLLIDFVNFDLKYVNDLLIDFVNFDLRYYVIEYLYYYLKY